jgi:predicted transcriptional regulator
MKAKAPARAGADANLGGGFPHPNGLSRRITELLRWGDLVDRYGSRSEVLQAVVTEMVRLRWSFDAAYSTLRNPRNAGGEHLRTNRHGRSRSEGRAQKQLQRAWRTAETFLSERPDFRNRVDVVAELTRIREAVLDHPWKGRGGATDQAVMLALLDIAMPVGKIEVHASTRELAVRIVSGTATTSRALGRLHRAGWISRTRRASGPRAAWWRINRRARPNHLGLREHDLREVQPEAFCWAGLGWSKGRVYALLDQEVRSPQELSATLGIGVATVRKHLQTLEAYGLAKRVMDGFVAGQTDPARITGTLGTRGRQERQRQEYGRSREWFRARYGRPGVDMLTGEIRHASPDHSGLTPGVNECSVDARPSLLEQAEAVIREVFGDENVELVERMIA